MPDVYERLILDVCFVDLKCISFAQMNWQKLGASSHFLLHQIEGDKVKSLPYKYST